MTNYCVICGDEIPEGRQVCPHCEKMSRATNAIRPAVNVAWSRIGELITGISRQYEMPSGDPETCRNYAREIMLQCDIIEELKEHDS